MQIFINTPFNSSTTHFLILLNLTQITHVIYLEDKKALTDESQSPLSHSEGSYRPDLVCV